MNKQLTNRILQFQKFNAENNNFNFGMKVLKHVRVLSRHFQAYSYISAADLGGDNPLLSGPTYFFFLLSLTLYLQSKRRG